MNDKYETIDFYDNIDDFKCPICYGFIGFDALQDQNGHVFCKYCITKWLSKKHTCPLDGTELYINHLIQIPFILKSIMKNIQVKCKKCNLIYELKDEHTNKICEISCKKKVNEYDEINNKTDLKKDFLNFKVEKNLIEIELIKKNIEVSMLKKSLENLKDKHACDEFYCSQKRDYYDLINECDRNIEITKAIRTLFLCDVKLQGYFYPMGLFEEYNKSIEKLMNFEQRLKKEKNAAKLELFQKYLNKWILNSENLKTKMKDNYRKRNTDWAIGPTGAPLPPAVWSGDIRRSQSFVSCSIQ